MRNWNSPAYNEANGVRHEEITVQRVTVHQDPVKEVEGSRLAKEVGLSPPGRRSMDFMSDGLFYGLGLWKTSSLGEITGRIRLLYSLDTHFRLIQIDRTGSFTLSLVDNCAA